MTRGILFGLLLLFFSSLVELIVSSIVYYQLERALNFTYIIQFPLNAYAVSVGVISLVAVLVIFPVQFFVAKKEATILTMVIGAFLAVWWLIAILILTNSIFQSLGNGYFSAYMALGASLYLLSQCQLQQTLSK